MSAPNRPVPALKTRKPTCAPQWPFILLAGVPKGGKSYAAAALSASDLVDRTFYIDYAENAADMYGAIPGARLEIVEHDGSIADILGQIRAIKALGNNPAKPNVIVFDSLTELWEALKDEGQAIADGRNRNPNREASITMDIWNKSKDRFNSVIDELRDWDGLVIATSRLEQVAVMGPNGQPTAEKMWKIQTEKNLAGKADAIVMIRDMRQTSVTGVRSTTLTIPEGQELKMPGFTVDKLLRQMGFPAVANTAERPAFVAANAATVADATVSLAEAKAKFGATLREAHPVLADEQKFRTVANAMWLKAAFADDTPVPAKDLEALLTAAKSADALTVLPAEAATDAPAA